MSMRMWMLAPIFFVFVINTEARAEVSVVADFQGYETGQALTSGPALFKIDPAGNGPEPTAEDVKNDGDRVGWFPNRGAGNYTHHNVSVAEGDSATLQFDLLLTGRTTDATIGVGTRAGIADNSDTTGSIRVDGEGGDGFNPVIQSLDGPDGKWVDHGTLSIGVQYTITIVMDTAANTFDVWLQGGPEYPENTQIVRGYRFWNTSDKDLDFFLIRTNHTNKPGVVVLDDVYLDDNTARTDRFNVPETGS